MRAGVVSSSGLMTLRCGTHKFFYFCMIEMRLFHIVTSSVGFPPLPNPPPMIDEEKGEATTHRIASF
jgi:hypothetical protein